MTFDTRLSSVLHAILHLAGSSEPMTSAQLAKCLGTNPVVVRRIMAGLRDAGLVVAVKGHRGGWSLGRPLSEATLFDVHRALGAPRLVGIGNRSEDPQCLLERAANSALDETRREAEEIILRRMHQVSLSDVSNAARRVIAQKSDR